MKRQKKTLGGESSKAEAVSLTLSDLPRPFCGEILTAIDIGGLVAESVTAIDGHCTEHGFLAFGYDVIRGVLMTASGIDLYKPSAKKRWPRSPSYQKNAGVLLEQFIRPSEKGRLSHGLFD